MISRYRLPYGRASRKVRVRLLRVDTFFSLDEFEHAALFEDLDYVWDVLKRLPSYIQEVLKPGIEGNVHAGAIITGPVYIAPGAEVEPGVMIKGPAIIGEGTVVRHGAYIRENVIVGKNCVVGHATELKGVIMFDGAQAPHFNYVGDSVLGRGVNLGAGTRLANMKNDGSEVVVQMDGQSVHTGLRKFGAIVGDRVYTGCNAVASPGTLIGRGSRVYPGAVLRGAYPPDSIVKVRQVQEVVSVEY